MSDSESDAIIMRTENAVFRGRGPNISSAPNRKLQSSLASISNSEPLFPKRSNYFRRETSPRSISSLREQTRFQHSFDNGGLSSQRSIKNSRLGSPESMRSTESNISVATQEVLNGLHALENEQLSGLEMWLINKIWKSKMRKFMKSEHKRKKIEKRSRSKLMLWKLRRNSENSSGDQRNDSSLSSDESRVTSRTRDFIPNEQSINPLGSKINKIKRLMKSSDSFKDSTDKITSSSFRNINNSHWQMSQGQERNENIPQKCNLKNNVLLPSLRFNKTKDLRTITEEKSDKPERNTKRNNLLMSKPVEESESEEIFSNTDLNLMNSKENPIIKKTVTSVDIHSKGDEKRTILVTHKNSSNIQKNKDNDFVFPVPQFPAKKRPEVKPKEKIISKSAQPFDGTIQPELIINNTNVVTEKLDDNSKKAKEQLEITQNNTNNLSMKQSFMRRKLFTQTLVATETTNMSSDDIHTPQANRYSEKQKHKTRKLVKSQACLSRDITESDNNVNLLSKVVPNEDVNVPVATMKQNGNTTKPKTSSNITSKSVKENWDITSMVSTCQDDNASETYTDEIFNINETIIDKRNKSVEKYNVQQKTQEINNNCGTKDKRKPNNQKKVSNTSTPKAKRSNITPRKENERNYQEKNCINKYVESFWATDIESEIEDINKRQKSRGTPANRLQANKDVSASLNPAVISDSIEFAIEDSLKPKNYKERNQKIIEVKKTNNKREVLTSRANKHKNKKEISKNVTTAETLLEKQRSKITMRTRRHDQIEKEGNDSFGFLNFNLCKDIKKNLEDERIIPSESTRVLRGKNKSSNISQTSYDVNMNCSTNSDRVLRLKLNRTVMKCCETTLQSSKSSPVLQLNRTLRSRVIDLSLSNSIGSKIGSSKRVKNKRSKKG